eukprot:15371-Eustigmatos_ZCMA.PRE.1
MAYLRSAQDEEGRTLLHWAADGGHAELVQALIAAGADLSIKVALDPRNMVPQTAVTEDGACHGLYCSCASHDLTRTCAMVTG